MRTPSLFIVFMSLASLARAQEPLLQELSPDSSVTLCMVQEQPEFPGGWDALKAFLVKEGRYPKMAANAGIQGKVYVTFLVDTDGRVKDVGIARGVHPVLDKEAMRVVRRMPRWKPGMINGRAVTARYQLPVNFKLPLLGLSD